MHERGAHPSRQEFSSRLGWLVVPLFVVGGLLGCRWWWDHRDYCAGIGDEVRRASEHEIVAWYGPPKSRWTTSPGGLGVMQGTDVSHRQMFGDVPDPVVLQFCWELPNKGVRYVWFGRVGDGAWCAFDGVEFRGWYF